MFYKDFIFHKITNWQYKQTSFTSTNDSIVKSNVAVPFYINETIDWEKVIKKEARGLDDYDLGEVQELNDEHVITKKGVVDKDRFYLPRNKVSKFDGDKLWFEVTKDDAKTYKHD